MNLSLTSLPAIISALLIPILSKFFLSVEVLPSLFDVSNIISFPNLNLLDNADFKPNFLTFLLILCA